MADEEKGAEAEGRTDPAGTDDIEGLDWSCLLMGVERIIADPEDDDGEDIFSVKFQVDGPNANAEIEIIVSDFTDEAHVISIAQHTLHVAMTMWSRITAERFIRARAKDLPDG